MNKDQSEYYRKLSGSPIGHSIVRYGNYPISFPTYIGKFPDRPIVTARDIEERKSEFLNRFAIPEAPVSSLRIAPPTDIIDINSIPPDAAIIFRTLNRTPFLNFTNLYKTAKLSTTSATEARDWLVLNNYIETNSILANKGGRKSLFLDLTDKAYMLLGTKKPYSGKVSFEHRLYTYIVASNLESYNWDVTIEAITTKPDSQHKMDILAMRHGENLDFEITISTQNVRNNIEKGFQDERVTKVIIVSDKKTLQACKTKTADLMTQFNGRLEFRPISDFYPGK